MTQLARGADSLDRALSTTTCRDRLLQMLTLLESADGVTREALLAAVEATSCPQGHDLHYANLMSGVIARDDDGYFRLSRAGDDFLLDNGAPTPDWTRHVHPGAPALRNWQVEALRAWCAHGRHGVVEAVTGTGKSRVGIEATREALAADFSVVVAVPTRDLVDQWVKALRLNGVPDVGALSDGSKASFKTHRVVVGTIQALYPDPPVRADGKALIVADECHRYGSEQWRRALHVSYRRRLGLTATFERNDEGINHLITYFSGGPVYRIGFDQAIADGVVAQRSRAPRRRPDACRTRRLRRGRPCSEGLPHATARRRLSGRAVRCVSARGATGCRGRIGHGGPDRRRCRPSIPQSVFRTHRRTLERFGQARRRPFPRAPRPGLARRPVVHAAGGYRRRGRGHPRAGWRPREFDPSKLTPTERRDRLVGLKSGRYKALAAPTVLDEGIDVPDIDLAVVLGGSKSRRQMIQRMGRVLRLKSDGRKATFIVVYANDTIEDLTRNDGAEGCLDLIVASADSVSDLVFDAETPLQQAQPPQAQPPDAQPPEAEDLRSEPGQAAGDALPTLHTLRSALDPAAVPVSGAARKRFGTALELHGSTKDDVEEAVRQELARDLVGGTAERCGNGRIAVRGERGTWYLNKQAKVVLRFRPRQPDNDPSVTTSARIDDPALSEASQQDRDPGPDVGDAIPGTDLVDQLERLAALRERGLLTDREFALAKSRLLA